MSYKITPCFFSLKDFGDNYPVPEQLHRVAYDKCNFRCGFCDCSHRSARGYADYTEGEFRNVIRNLFARSRYFKFTGGEPTLNPQLPGELRIVKELGGIVFLDSNGSLPEVIRNMAENALIDVLGISLKGNSAETAAMVANIQDTRLCWDNVFRTLEIAEEHGVRTLVTMVFHRDFPLQMLPSFAELIFPYPHVRMKINNIIPCDFQGTDDYEGLDPSVMESTVQDFVSRNPMWKNRVTLVSSPEAMRDYGKVVFL